MTISELAKEYSILTEKLHEGDEFIRLCRDMVSEYYFVLTGSARNYFKGETSSPATTFATSFTQIYKDINKYAAQLLRPSYKFLRSAEHIKEMRLSIPSLQKAIDEYNNCANHIHACIYTILEDNNCFKTSDVAFEFILDAHTLINRYESLEIIGSQLPDIEKLLIQEITEDITTDTNYNMLEIHSKKHNATLEQYSNDLANLSSFIMQLELLMKTDTLTPQIYLRRFESGSLHISWGSNTIDLSSISDIIKALVDGICQFRLIGPQRELLKEEARSKRLDNDAKALAIINSQIDKIASTLALDPNNPECKEQLQKLCLPAVRYIHNNPVGQVGEYKYNLSQEIRYLQDFYFDNLESERPLE